MRPIVLTALALCIGACQASAQPSYPDTGGLGAGSSLVHRTEILGTDDRVSAHFKSKAGVSGIGRIGHAPSRTSCTAFCVAPDVIATNAHCVSRRPDGVQSFDLNGARFTRGSKWAAIQIADRREPELSIYRGSQSGNTGFKDFASDWAFVKLRLAICRDHVMQFAQLSDQQLLRAARNKHLDLFGFHHDKWGNSLWVSPDCTVRFPRPGDRLLNSQSNRQLAVGNLIYHTCDTAEGASGAPILIATSGGTRVAAINAGSLRFRKWRKSTPVSPRKLIVHQEMNVAVRPVFLGGLRRFRSETLIGGKAYYMALQGRLQQLRYYAGAIDGSFGPLSIAALMQYERDRGLTPIGLPTREVLERLEQDRTVRRD